MIIDNTLVLSESQGPITATARSTNIIDIGAAGTAYGHAATVPRDIGKGTDIEVTVTVVQAFNNLTSLKVALESDDDVAFGSPKEVASKTYLLAELTLGKQLSFPAKIPEGADERYLSLNYTVAGTAPSTGKLFSAIVAARQTQ
jgi:hypothetical protein